MHIYIYTTLISGNTDTNVLYEIDTDTNVLYDLIAVKLPEVGNSLTSLRLCVCPHTATYRFGRVLRGCSWSGSHFALTCADVC